MLAALTGILCYKKFKHTPTKYFIWFLVYVFLMELIAAYPRYVYKYEFLKEAEVFLKGTRFEKNYWFYTFFWIIASTLFYGFYFRELIDNQKFKKLLKYMLIGFCIFCIIYLALNWDVLFKGRTIPIDVFGIVTIMLAIILYLVEILNSNKVLVFYKSIDFYIAITLILWYIIVTPLAFYNMYFIKEDWSFILLKWQIMLFANIAMYLTFTLALIFCKPETNSEFT